MGITKKTWADAYMALDEDEPAIDCFQNLVQPLFLHSSPIRNCPHKSRIWRALYAVFIANEDQVTFQSCYGKCLGLGT